MLYYCPFECREDRYTMQLSAPVIGWNERAWRKFDVKYTRIEGFDVDKPEMAGTIFDLPRRSRWCLNQVIKLLHLYESGRLSNQDTIYFDDFLHPGIEALTLSIPPEQWPSMYAWMHGTALDPYDMLQARDGLFEQRWVRAYEELNLCILDGVFVATPSLKDMIVKGYGHKVRSKLYATGHVWDTEEVMARMPSEALPRENMVVYASRWDSCKDPHTFLEVAEAVHDAWGSELPKPRFVVCSSAHAIQSDLPSLVTDLYDAVAVGYVEVHTGLTKNKYYEMLSQAKVVFASSLMDWTSYVLLEGAAAGAYPVFPHNHCFEDALWGNGEYLYEAGNLASATSYVMDVLATEKDLWTEQAINSRSWIYRQFDRTWERRLSVMNLCPSSISYSLWGDD